VSLTTPLVHARLNCGNKKEVTKLKCLYAYQERLDQGSAT